MYIYSKIKCKIIALQITSLPGAGQGRGSDGVAVALVQQTPIERERQWVRERERGAER